jgi:hypothetical protein
MDNKYQEVNGTSYNINTDINIINVLENARISNTRIRIFYGKDGIDWNETFDTIGSIGRSTGTFRVPLLIKNKRYQGGCAILDDCIIRITIDKKNVYMHKNYTYGNFELIKTKNQELNDKGYFFSVLKNKITLANFKTELKAQKYIDFLKGDRNKY